MDFFNRYKKIFLIIGFLVLCFLMAYLIYTLFFKQAFSPLQKPENRDTSVPGGTFPNANEGPGNIISEEEAKRTEDEAHQIFPEASDVALGGLTKTKTLDDSPALAPTLSSDGSSLKYYDQNENKFYQIDKYGEKKLLSDKIFHNVESVAWSNKTNKAVLEYPDGANIVYDFDKQTQTTLPAHWKEFEFAPNSDQIVMKSMGQNEENRWLAIVNDNGSKVRAIEALGDKDDTVYPNWSPNGEFVAMFTEGKGFDQQELYFVGLNNENFKSTTIEGRGFKPLWNQEGNRLLYSVYSSENEMKPELWIVDAQGDSISNNRQKLNIETWADKCAFSNNTELYCAVPQNLEKGAGLFPELADNSIDHLYKINTKTGLKKLIAIPDQNFNISNLIISEDNHYIYFTDKLDGSLHQIKLR